MARGPSTSPSRQSRKTPAKKTPARAKRPAATAPARGTPKKTSARKAATAPAKKGAGRKASKVKGKPKTASTASHKGASKAQPRSPKTSTRRAASAQQQKDLAASEDAAPSGIGQRIVVENVNVPGYKNTVDATKYATVRDALVKALPKRSPGLTQDEMLAAVQPRLEGDLASKAMWWIKTVQLDLEAKKRMTREATKPLRWHLA